MPYFLRGKLIDGNTGANLGALTLKRLHAGQVHPGTTGMIPGSVAVGTALVLGQSAENGDVSLDR